MVKFRRKVTNNKGEVYEPTFILRGNKLVDFSCTCRFMSYDYWSKKFQASGTLCRHILKVCEDEGIELPDKNKTERNFRIMESFKNK